MILRVPFTRFFAVLESAYSRYIGRVVPVSSTFPVKAMEMVERILRAFLALLPVLEIPVASRPSAHPIVSRDA